MMDWEKLLTRQRLGKSKLEPEEFIRTPFQRDYDRLIFSSAFRRLKDKTQVFPLPTNDYIRTRLIHSLEVSSVGRSLGRIIGRAIVERHQLQGKVDAADVGDIVSAACLAHDIGNPPFGHAGEDAIQAAFQTWYDPAKSFNDRQKNDLDLFEGNAQGFRILTRLEMQPRRGGLQLTYPTLAAFTKYPRESTIDPQIIDDYAGRSSKKHGFFQSEVDLFTEVAEAVGLIRRSENAAWWCRHPLAFLVEAADDICYSIVDLEDGCLMGYIPFAVARELLDPIAGSQDDKLADIALESERIKYLRGAAINNLINEAKEIFLDNEGSILAGEFDKDLLSLSGKYELPLKNIASETRSRVFDHPDVINIQIAGYEVLDKLFADFANAILSDTKKAKLICKMLPPEYRPIAGESNYEQILKITDYISGMTDFYATKLFQQFTMNYS
jgi:dGTPase